MGGSLGISRGNGVGMGVGGRGPIWGREGRYLKIKIEGVNWEGIVFFYNKGISVIFLGGVVFIKKLRTENGKSFIMEYLKDEI